MSIQYEAYGRNVTSIWNIRPSSNARYGFEIETGWRTHEAMLDFFSTLESKRLDSYVIAKQDSSIEAAYDAEIVSRPLVIQEAKRVAKRVIDSYTEQPERTRSMSNCGVHVHTTRSAWSKAALILTRRAIMTYENETPGRTEFWDAVATRSANTYCQREDHLARVVFYNLSSCTVDNYFRNWKHREGHFDAVGWSKRHPTIEFRSWRCSPKPRTIASYLDTVDSLLRFNTKLVTEGDFKGSTLVSALPEFNALAYIEFVQVQPGYQALKWRIKNSGAIKRSIRTLRREAQNPTTPERIAAAQEETASPTLDARCTCDMLVPQNRCTCSCALCVQWRAQEHSNHYRREAEYLAAQLTQTPYSEPATCEHEAAEPTLVCYDPHHAQCSACARYCTIETSLTHYVQEGNE